MSAESSSVAAMIKRFREGKPTSKQERDEQRQHGGIDKMWWEKDGEASSEQPRPMPLVPVPHQPTNRSSPRNSTEYLVDNYRKPADYREPTGVFRNSTLGKSLDLDDMIVNEMQQLQEEIRRKEKEVAARMSLGSFNPKISLDNSGDFGMGGMRGAASHRRGGSGGSLGNSADFGLRGGGGGGGGTAITRMSFGASRDSSPFRLSSSMDGMSRLPGTFNMRGSGETLGDTGFRGLLVPDLKLDGRKPSENDAHNGENLDDINKKMQELLANMNKGRERISSFLPEGVEETIPQITNQLSVEMKNFLSNSEARYAAEMSQEQLRKEEEERIKEEGRKEERVRHLMTDHDSPPGNHPLEYLTLWNQSPLAQNGAAHSVVAGAGAGAGASLSPEIARWGLAGGGGGGGNNVVAPVATQATAAAAAGSVLTPIDTNVNNNGSSSSKTDVLASVSSDGDGTPFRAMQAGGAGGRDAFPTTAGDTATATADAAIAAAAGASRGPVKSAPAGRGSGSLFHNNVTTVQMAVDQEMNNAEQTWQRMRALRMGMGERMRHLDALHSTLVDPHQQQQQPLSSAAAAHLHLRGPVLSNMHPPAQYATASAQVPMSRGAAASAYMSARGAAGAVPGAQQQGGMMNRQWGLEGAPPPDDVADYGAGYRHMWNPYPDLVHENILSASKGIQSTLDVAMNTLHQRCPEGRLSDAAASAATAPPPPLATTTRAPTSAPTSDSIPPPPAAPPSSSDKLAADSAPSSSSSTTTATTIPAVVQPQDMEKKNNQSAEHVLAENVIGDLIKGQVTKIAAADPDISASEEKLEQKVKEIIEKNYANMPQFASKSAQEQFRDLDAILGEDETEFAAKGRQWGAAASAKDGGVSAGLGRFVPTDMQLQQLREEALSRIRNDGLSRQKATNSVYASPYLGGSSSSSSNNSTSNSNDKQQQNQQKQNKLNKQQQVMQREPKYIDAPSDEQLVLRQRQYGDNTASTSRARAGAGSDAVQGRPQPSAPAAPLRSDTLLRHQQRELQKQQEKYEREMFAYPKPGSSSSGSGGTGYINNQQGQMMNMMDGRTSWQGMGEGPTSKAVELAYGRPLNRPVEGSALKQLRATKNSSVTGNSDYNGHHNTGSPSSVVDQPALYHGADSYYNKPLPPPQQQQLPSGYYPYSAASTAYNSSSSHSSASSATEQAMSPQGGHGSTRDRELYLQSMRKMRHHLSITY